MFRECMSLNRYYVVKLLTFCYLLYVFLGDDPDNISSSGTEDDGDVTDVPSSDVEFKGTCTLLL